MDTSKIEQFVNTLADTGTKLANNIPVYITEYLNYHFFHEVYWVIIAISGILIPFIIAKHLKSREDAINPCLFLGKTIGMEAIPLWIISVIVWLISGINLIIAIHNIIEIKFFPEVFLINQILYRHCN